MFRFRPVLAVAALAGAVTFAAPAPPAVADDAPQIFKLDANHSTVGFRIRHFFTKVNGRFETFTGHVQWDPSDLKTMGVEAVIDAASVDTDNERRDGHLRQADFFDVEKHPKLIFKSTGVKGVEGNRVQLEGVLTIRGVTKPVLLDVEVLGTTPGFRGETRAGFEARTTINRKDFGIVWNRALDSGGAMLSDEVEIVLDIEAILPPPEQS